jgi:hypothetical protein
VQLQDEARQENEKLCLMLEDLRATVGRISTELDAAKVREQDMLHKAEDSTNELESMRRCLSSMEEQLRQQTAEVRSLHSR